MMLGAKGKKLLEKFILAIKCFSLTSLLLRSHWSELVTWLYPTTVEQRSLFFLVPRKRVGQWRSTKDHHGYLSVVSAELASVCAFFF